MTSTPTEASTVLGIAFGNSTTQIAYISRAHVPECIANEDGDRQIPSILSYSEGEEYHGGQAKSQLVRNSANTIILFRDWLGQKSLLPSKTLSLNPCDTDSSRFSGIDIERAKYSAKPHVTDSGDVAFNITTLVPKLRTAPPTPSASGTSTPLPRTGTSTPLPPPSPDDDTEPEYEQHTQSLSVTQIITAHLTRIKQSAQHFLGHPPQGAVYTVPTNFSTAQREDLKLASQSAGIPCLQIIHEPTAALLAYNSLFVSPPTTILQDKKILVLDVGGVRLDATIIAVRAGMYTILSTAHAHGFTPGEDLDRVLYEHLRGEWKKKVKLDTESDVRARWKLVLEAESVKKTLSASASANVSVESLMDGLDFKSSINRVRFDMLARKIYQRIAEFALEAVKKATLEPIDIDEVSSLSFCGFACLRLGVIGRRNISVTETRVNIAILVPGTNRRFTDNV